MDNDKKRFANLPAVLYAVYVFLLAAIIPPYQVPDEPKHLLRAYQISEGEWRGTAYQDSAGGRLPVSLEHTRRLLKKDISFHPERKFQLSGLRAALKIPLDANERMDMQFPNTVRYFPLAYAPQSLTIAVGRKLNLPPIMLLYLGRAAGGVAALFLLWLAFRIVPGPFKYAAGLLVWSPMFAFLVASLSADSMLNAIAMLYLCIVAHMAFVNDEQIRPRHVAVLALFATCLIIIKPPYLFVACASLLIPAGRFANRKQHLMSQAIILFSAVGMTMLWMHIAQTPARIQRSTHVTIPAEQLLFVFQHPFTFLANVLHDLGVHGKAYAHSWVGILGWFDTPIPFPFVLVYIVLFAAASIASARSVTVRAWQKLLSLSLICATYLAVIVAIYTDFNPVGSAGIQGISGRYFIPLGILITFLLSSNRAARAMRMQPDSKGFRMVYVAFVCALSLVTIGTVIQRYYIL